MAKKFRNIKDLIEYPKSGILSKALVKTNKINVTLFCMVKGTELGEHTSTKHGFVFVLEGEGIFNLEGKDIKMQPDVLISMKRNAVHSLKARKNMSFVLILYE